MVHKKAVGGFPESKLRRRGYKVDDGLMSVLKSTVPMGKSFVDIGAGNGRYVRAMIKEGYRSKGYDGAENVFEVSGGLVSFLDLTSPQACRKEEISDWGLFNEVGEHVPEKFETVLIENVCSLCREGIIVSWARPGQRGHGHVNCRTPQYVAFQFARCGWLVDVELTNAANARVGRSYRGKILILSNFGASHVINKGNGTVECDC